MILDGDKTIEVRARHLDPSQLPRRIQLIHTRDPGTDGSAWSGNYASGIVTIYDSIRSSTTAIDTPAWRAGHRLSSSELKGLGYTGGLAMYCLRDPVRYSSNLYHAPYVHRGPPTWS